MKAFLQRIVATPAGEYALKLLITAAVGLVTLHFVMDILHEGEFEIRSVALNSGVPSITITRADNKEIERLFILYPQAWHSTGIEVQAGDTLRFLADGRINIGLYRLIQSVQTRRAVEERLRCASPAICDRTARGQSFREALARDPEHTTPEQYFTASQIDSMRPLHPWIGPDGIPGRTTDASYAGRTARLITTEAQYGAIVGLIRETASRSSLPTRAEFGRVFRVGSEGSYIVKEHGYVWLVVNDLWNDATPAFSDMFYIDNVGSFSVGVIVSRAGT